MCEIQTLPRRQHSSICEKGRLTEQAHGSKSTSIKSQAITLPHRHYLKSFNVLQGRWILNSQSCASVRPVNECFPPSRWAVLCDTPLFCHLLTALYALTSLVGPYEKHASVNTEYTLPPTVCLLLGNYMRWH